MGRKSHGEDYTDAELDFIASVAHSVQCGIDYAFGLPELHQWGLMGDGYKSQMKASVRAVLVHDKSPKSLHGAWVGRLTQEGWVHGELKDKENPSVISSVRRSSYRMEASSSSIQSSSHSF